MKTTRRINENSTPKEIHFRPVKFRVDPLYFTRGRGKNKYNTSGKQITLFHSIDGTKTVIHVTESEALYLAKQLMGLSSGRYSFIIDATNTQVEVLLESKMNHDIIVTNESKINFDND